MIGVWIFFEFISGLCFLLFSWFLRVCIGSRCLSLVCFKYLLFI